MEPKNRITSTLSCFSPFLLVLTLFLLTGIAPAQEHRTFRAPFQTVSGMILRDGTWASVAAGSSVTQITFFSGSGGQSFANGTAACPSSSGNGSGQCIRTILAQSHTLLRLTMDISSIPVGCGTNAVVGFKDLTSGTVLASLTITNGTGATLQDSGALSVSMTSGDQFGLALLTSPVGCSTSPGIYTLTAVYQ